MTPPRDEPFLGARYAVGAPATRPLRPEQAEARDEFLARRERGDFPEEPIDCLCGAPDGANESVVALVDRYGMPNRVVLCAACGLGRISPRMTPAAYGSFYAGLYRRIYSKTSGGPAAVFDAYARGKGQPLLRSLSRYFDPAGARVVEIGCGGGWNLAPFANAGATVVGWDFDEEFLAEGRRRGLDLRRGGIAEAAAAGDRFDLAILSHVAEHMLDPVAELRTARSLLAPGGRLYVEVPGWLRVPEAKGDPMYILQNAHTWYFCLTTLSDVLRRAGFLPLYGDEECATLWTPADGAEADAEKSRGGGQTNPGLAHFIRTYLLRCEAERARRAETRADPGNAKAGGGRAGPIRRFFGGRRR